MLDRFILTAIIICLSTSCAPPANEFANQNFIPRKEIITASTVNEGLVYLKSSRFIEAAMRFYEASIIYPNVDNIKANIALSLKGLELYDQSILIYNDLIKRNPKYTDYLYALADTYFRAGLYDKAFSSYNEAIIKYETNNEITKAAYTARTVSTSYFFLGKEELALCYSQFSLNYTTPTQQEAILHTRLLLATGKANEAKSFLSTYVNVTPEPKDSLLLKTAAMIDLELENLDIGKRYLELATEYGFYAAEPDQELIVLNRIIKEEEQSSNSNSIDNEDEEIPLPILDNAKLLYWPKKLSAKYIKLKDAEEAKE
jgi:tetratricopeptide (TPR) repeat protein